MQEKMVFFDAIPHVNTIDVFLRMTGSTDQKSLVYLSYAECMITSYLCVSTFVQLFGNYSKHELTITLFTLIILLIEAYILLSIVFRLYHQRHFREMDLYSKFVQIPDGYQSKITLITNYHLIGSNLFVMFPALYTLLDRSVRAGDHFTFPFLDVVPLKTSNGVIYACKYLFYAIPVYIAHLELCFINTPFIHYVGVLKSRFRVIVLTIDDALTSKDEQKLRNAIVQHQQLLKCFGTMKHVFAKPIILSIMFNGIYFGMSTYFVIQAIQGVINYELLIICIASNVAAAINISVYSFYGSELSVFHDNVLHALFDNTLFRSSKTFKQSSLMIMARCMFPLQFTVGYIITVDLDLLVKILKISYSVLNVLLSSPVKKV